LFFFFHDLVFWVRSQQDRGACCFSGIGCGSQGHTSSTTTGVDALALVLPQADPGAVALGVLVSASQCLQADSAYDEQARTWRLA